MWIATEVADWFDKTRADNDAWIDRGLQPWVATTLYDDSPWYRNVGVWTAAGVLYALNKFTTKVASGFVDVLRLGDGFKEGGWGYGKDALRLLMVVGPALRGARYLTTLVPAVDTSPTVGNCSWVAATRLLRLTGVKPLAELRNVAPWMGFEVSETAGIWPEELAPALRHLGAEAKTVDLVAEASRTSGSVISTEEALAKVVSANPNGAVMFSVNWQMGGRPVGHTLIAVRNFFGGMTIIDRSGRAVKTLAELEEASKFGPGYPSIGQAVIDAEGVVIQNSAVVRSLGTIPTLTNIITQGAFGYGYGDGQQPRSTSPGGSSQQAPASPSAQGPLPPEAQRLYDALPPRVLMDWKQVTQRIMPPLTDPYGSLQLLEKTGRVLVTRWGIDSLNIRTVYRL